MQSSVTRFDYFFIISISLLIFCFCNFSITSSHLLSIHKLIFTFNSDGDFVKYSTFRFKDNEEDSKRYEWVLKVDHYNTFEGIKVPSSMRASWKLENMDWNWLQLEIKDLKYNDNVVYE